MHFLPSLCRWHTLTELGESGTRTQVILWELTTLQIPWEECAHPYQLVHLVVEQGLRPPMPTSCEPATSVFVAVCALIQVRSQTQHGGLHKGSPASPSKEVLCSH
jgi:hypothetical protein